MRYKLLVRGWGLEGIAHDLTSAEVEKLRSHKKNAGYEDLNQIYSELPQLLDGFDFSSPNWWMATRPCLDEDLTFVLLDGDDNVLWEKKNNELGKVYDLLDKYTLPENFEDSSEFLDAYPCNEHQNILCIIEDIKGTFSSYFIESDETPLPENFAFTSTSIESPIFDYEVIDKIFFKDIELEKDFEEEWVRGKSLKINIFTLEDVESGVYDETHEDSED